MKSFLPFGLEGPRSLALPQFPTSARDEAGCPARCCPPPGCPRQPRAARFKLLRFPRCPSAAGPSRPPHRLLSLAPDPGPAGRSISTQVRGQGEGSRAAPFPGNAGDDSETITTCLSLKCPVTPPPPQPGAQRAPKSPSPSLFFFFFFLFVVDFVIH